MLSKWLFISLLVLIVQNITASTDFIDVTKYDMIYYDPNTGVGLEAYLEDTSRGPVIAIGFRGAGCQCEGFTCSCCIGVNITKYNFDRRVCNNFTYIPEDSALHTKLILNREIFSSNFISLKNPTPFCVPVIPFLSLCVRFYDIALNGANVHACLDFETLVGQWPILVLHFDCLSIGLGGISWTKPESNVLMMEQVNKPEVNGPEVYDEVNFEPDSIDLPNNHTPSVTLEEDHIGQLKL
ncbi:uncharacterized protein LOC105433336 [Pogonomyrmex barbatus]|uniref:Uncharacterized protein LOC105433336 n=1 Tax=Pogonomyrmex barbatus TaxID=144034 RepID=A0A6I9WSH7_9HYME|nr:uncharacterized protein LOC105433336 [Pogonomyrmex barbatus]